MKGWGKKHYFHIKKCLKDYIKILYGLLPHLTVLTCLCQAVNAEVWISPIRKSQPNLQILWLLSFQVDQQLGSTAPCWWETHNGVRCPSALILKNCFHNYNLASTIFLLKLAFPQSTKPILRVVLLLVLQIVFRFFSPALFQGGFCLFELTPLPHKHFLNNE